MIVGDVWGSEVISAIRGRPLYDIRGGWPPRPAGGGGGCVAIFSTNVTGVSIDI